MKKQSPETENITYPICLISIIFRNSYKLVRKKEIMYWKNRRHNRTDASQKDIQMSSRHEKMHNSLVIRKKCKLNLSATRLPPHSAGWLQWRRQYQELVSTWRNRNSYTACRSVNWYRDFEKLALYSTSRNILSRSAYTCSPKDNHKKASAALFTTTPCWKKSISINLCIQ